MEKIIVYGNAPKRLMDTATGIMEQPEFFYRGFLPLDYSCQSRISTTPLYGSEAWMCYAHHLKQLEQCHQRRLQRILHVSWRERRTNISILTKLLTSIENDNSKLAPLDRARC